MFRMRDHQIERSTIEDVHFKKRLLLDRLIIRTNGKQQQFYFFKDIANRGSRAYEILQVHKALPQKSAVKLGPGQYRER